MSMTLEEIYKNIKLNPKTDCWIWKGSVAGSGIHLYGHISYKKKHVYVHRLMYEIHKGKIQKGLTIDHLCRVTRCVNPAHLEAVTMKENILRGVGRGAINARKVVCQNGHPFSATSKGHRMCKVCNLNNWHKRYSDPIIRVQEIKRSIKYYNKNKLRIAKAWRKKYMENKDVYNKKRRDMYSITKDKLNARRRIIYKKQLLTTN